MDGPAEIGKLELTIQTDENVLWLDITVDDVLGVAVVDGVGHLDDVASSSLLIEALLITKEFEEFTTGGVFDDKIDTCLVPEISIKSDDVWMAEM